MRRVAEARYAGGLDPVVVVTGFARQEAEAALAGLPVRFVHNAAFERGLASSLKAGVAALPGDCAGAAILLADMPMVSASLIGALADAFRANPQASAIAPTWKGRRGNPVVIAARLFTDVAKLQGDVGARPLLEGRDDVIECSVEDASVALDVDTPDALSQLRR